MCNHATHNDVNQECIAPPSRNQVKIRQASPRRPGQGTRPHTFDEEIEGVDHGEDGYALVVIRSRN